MRARRLVTVAAASVLGMAFVGGVVLRDAAPAFARAAAPGAEASQTEAAFASLKAADPKAAGRCGSGKVAVVANSVKLCVPGRPLFGPSRGDEATDALAGAFVGEPLWASLAGDVTVAHALGGDAAEVARWQLAVYQAARSAIRGYTGRGLLRAGGDGGFEGSFAADAGTPLGWDWLTDKVKGLVEEKGPGEESGETDATAAIDKGAVTFDFKLSPSWQVEQCPNTKGVFKAYRTLSLNKQIIDRGGTVAVERVEVAVTLLGHVNESSHVDSYSLKVVATATDSKGGHWTVTAGGHNKRPPQAKDDELPALPQFVVDSPVITATVNGHPMDPQGAANAIAVYLDDVVRAATEEARKHAFAEIDEAVTTFYTKHKCNTIKFKPATLNLAPGETATIEATMNNVSRKPGNPKWKAKNITAQGVNVLSKTPTKNGKGLDIKVQRKGGRFLEAAGAADVASLTVDGVSIRGRGLGTIHLGGRPDYPKRFVGHATLEMNGQDPTGWVKQSYKMDVTFEHDVKSHVWYVVTGGTIRFTDRGRKYDCSWDGSGSQPLNKYAGVLELSWDNRAGSFRAVFSAPEGAASYPRTEMCDYGTEVEEAGVFNPLWPLARNTAGFSVDADSLSFGGSKSDSSSWGSGGEGTLASTWTWEFQGIR